MEHGRNTDEGFSFALFPCSIRLHPWLNQQLAHGKICRVTAIKEAARILLQKSWKSIRMDPDVNKFKWSRRFRAAISSGTSACLAKIQVSLSGSILCSEGMLLGDRW